MFNCIEELNQKHNLEKTELEEKFNQRIEEAKVESVKELKNTTAGLADKHKKEMRKIIFLNSFVKTALRNVCI